VISITNFLEIKSEVEKDRLAYFFKKIVGMQEVTMEEQRLEFMQHFNILL
jgi:hypothetical protein